MGVDILTSILSKFVEEGRESIVSGFISVLDFSTVFNCEEVFQEKVGVDITPVSNVVFTFAFYLLALKFVTKLFNTYILGADGNDDAEPVVHVVNMGKAIFISLAFGLLFSKMMAIGNEIANVILNVLKMKPLEFDDVLESLPVFVVANVGVSSLVLIIIFIVMTFVLTVTFTLNAIQLIILRVGISFSAVGLLDSDEGVFKPYMKKFFQICFAAIIQLVCYKLSLYALLNSSLLFALTLLTMALKAPAWLSEFIMTNQGGGGKLQQALYSYSILRSFTRKA